MVKYIKQEMPDMTGKGETKAYYRIRSVGNIDTREFIRLVSQAGGGLSEGSVSHVLYQMTSKLADLLGRGHTVTIDGLGTFKATLGVRRGKEMDSLDGEGEKLNARSIEVNGINFRVDKRLVQETDQGCVLERGPVCRLRRSPYTLEERLRLALDYLKENGVMRVMDYARLTGLSRSTAARELKAFRQDPASGLTFSGRGTAKVYVRDEANG